MERLREAVDALAHTLAALRLLRDANGAPAAEPGPDVAPGHRAGETRRAPIPWDDPPPRGEIRAAPPSETPAFAPFRDQVTGLHSWAGFESVASGELRRCLRRDRSFTILRLRPGTGDPGALRAVAQRLRNRVRASDHIGYQADRGFMLALAETAREEAVALSRRLVDVLRDAGGSDAERLMGLATYPEDGDSVAALLDAAGERADAPSGDGSGDGSVGTPGRSYPAG